MIETERGARLRSIARLLDRSASTISREVARGCSPAGRNRATQASRRYRKRRRASVRRRKIVEGSWLWQWVRDGLCYRYWSPHQIAARLRGMHPQDSDRHVSTETIYRISLHTSLYGLMTQRLTAPAGAASSDLAPSSQAQ